MNVRYGIAAALCLAAALVAAGRTAGQDLTSPKTYRVRHELTVTLPPNSQHARIWFTIPQDSPNQKTTDFKVEAPVAWQKVKDSHNNPYAFFEVRQPKAEKLPIVTTFDLSRSEVKSQVSAQKSRPFNEAELKEEQEEQKNTDIAGSLRQKALKVSLVPVSSVCPFALILTARGPMVATLQ